MVREGLLLACLLASVSAAVAGPSSSTVPLRLRGGTGQGGPSRGFRSKKGSRASWRHPHTLFDKSNKVDGPRPRAHLKNRRTVLMTGKVTGYQSQWKHRVRSRQPSYIKFTSSRGKRWLKEAMKDDAFRMGMGADVQPSEESLKWNWRANAKTPREWKTGLGGWGKPVKDFTNQYLGVCY